MSFPARDCLQLPGDYVQLGVLSAYCLQELRMLLLRLGFSAGGSLQLLGECVPLGLR